jgi:hypothetical protein
MGQFEHDLRSSEFVTVKEAKISIKKHFHHVKSYATDCVDISTPKSKMKKERFSRTALSLFTTINL